MGENERVAGALEGWPAWQSIETAPRDGTPILIWQPKYERSALGRRNTDPDTGLFYDDHCYAIGYWRPWGSWGNRNESDVHPSHWCPLPPALDSLAALPDTRKEVGDG